MRRFWYTLRSKPHKEFLLYDQLLARNLGCYFPRIRVTPVNPRASKVRPFFPSYMFVKADLDEIGLNTFKWMPYAQNLVCFDSIPSVVPTNIILGLKKNIGEIYEQGKAHPDRVEPGTRIQVTDGPFKGYTGVFDAHLDEHERVKILLDLIDHKQMPVKLNRGQIAPRI